MLFAALAAFTGAHAINNGVGQTPPMGWNSWNHFHCSVTADLLRQTADDFVELGLAAAGYKFINTDDCWSETNYVPLTKTSGRGEDGRIKPAVSFGNVSAIKELVKYIRSKGMKFGIYGAAGQTTCASRVGSLYHERIDAETFAEWGVEYLKYDNCGEVNLQSYAKFSAMSDALNATGARIFFSYEPHLTTPIEWPKYVGNAWRTGDDIGSRFSSVFKDLATANPWATVGGTGGWNDADMLEVGNPGLSIPEQRTHFALWALIKSPLLIGADVRTLAKASLDILLNRELIAVNQDALGVQAALVKASPAPPASLVSPVPPAGRVRSVAAAPVPPVLGSRASRGSPIHGMTTCDYGEDAPPPQTWGFTPDGRISQDGHTCLLSTDPPTLGPCTRVEAKGWETGRANMTTAQIKGPDGRCLNFIGGDDGIEAPGLFFAPCGEESPICAETRCATSSLVSELWYLSRHGQLIASWTAFPVPPIAGAGPGLDWPPVQWNPPYCLASKETEHPPVAPPKPSFVHGEPNASQPLQVWSGPLSANGTVVAFVNAGGGSHAISATWAELGIDGATPDTKCAVRDLWAMKDLSPAIGSLSATVDEHDSAVYRLTCPAPQ